MRKTQRFLISALSITVAIGGLLYAQQASIIPGTPYYGPGGSPFSDPDAMQLVVEPGELVVTLKAGPDGQPFVQRIRLADQTDPDVTVAVEPAQDGRFRYQYSVLNRPGARDSILLFALDTKRPEGLDHVTQPPAFRQGSLGDWGASIPKLNWWARDEGLLAPGSSAGPFVFDSALLPGLVTSYIRSNVWPDGLGFDVELLSEAHRAALLKALGLESNSVRRVTLGPKISTGPDVTAADVMKAVGEELRLAARLPEFEGLQHALLDLATRVDSGERSSQLFVGLEKTSLQRSFFLAMQWAVEHAARLP
jgi:hypothetical protein